MVYVESLKMSVQPEKVIRYGIITSPPTKKLFGGFKNNGVIGVRFNTTDRDWYGCEFNNIGLQHYEPTIESISNELKAIFVKSAPAEPEEARNITEQVPAQNAGLEQDEKKPGTSGEPGAL